MTSPVDLFQQINNAVLDLQSADYQTYPHPLKKLGRLLRHQDLAATNQNLVESVDLEAFLTKGESSQGGMLGSANLEWPDDDRKVLALQLLLVQRFCDNPDFMLDFGHTFYYGGSKVMSTINAVTAQLIIPFARDYRSHVLAAGSTEMKIIRPLSNKVFVVHGHDSEMRETVARFLEKTGFEAVILHEQASRGRTVIEKVEAHSEVGFAVVLLSPDDLGRSQAEADLKPRARQNVLLELGYFIGKLGRERVLSLKRGEVDIPSDFAGVVWEPFEGNGWKMTLARELEAAGHSFDWNKLK